MHANLSAFWSRALPTPPDSRASPTKPRTASILVLYECWPVATEARTFNVDPNGHPQQPKLTTQGESLHAVHSQSSVSSGALALGSVAVGQVSRGWRVQFRSLVLFLDSLAYRQRRILLSVGLHVTQRNEIPQSHSTWQMIKQSLYSYFNNTGHSE